MEHDVIIETRRLFKEYFLGRMKIEVLKNINLKIQGGEFLAIEGPSGSGKTTLLNLIGGLDRPTNGEILFESKNINEFNDDELANYRSQKIGFVFQFFNLMPHLTAIENILLPRIFFDDIKKEDEKKARELLLKMGLGERENHKSPELSGGEQQRIAIARALINEPKILLLDEPTGNLDSKNTQAIFQLLREINQKDKTTIIIGTHNIEIENFAQRIFKLKDGEIYED